MKFVFLSGVAWNSCVGGRTVQLALALSVSHEVHFVEIPSLRRWKAGKRRCGNITVHTLLPRSNRYIPRLTAAYLDRTIGLSDAVVVVSNPVWSEVVSAMDAGKIFYDYLDYVAIHSPDGKRTSELIAREKALMARADQILPVSRRLEEYVSSREKCCFLPNAVPASFLEREIIYPSKPVIGFHGALYEWVDYALLEEIADTFSDCTLLLAGAVRDPASVTNLQKKSNVEFIPAFSFTELPGIIDRFTVGIIPFLDDEVARCADPLKSYEYLSCGRRVVSTVSSAVESDMQVVTDRENFCRKLREALDAGASPDICRDAVREHTWEQRASVMVRLAGEIDG